MRFKVSAVCDADPVIFAKKMEDTLNSFVEEGWQVTSMIERGESFIVTAQKMEIAQLPQALLSELLPESSIDSGHVEVVYTFYEGPNSHSERFGSLADAVKRVREHITDSKFIPSAITVMTVTQYEALRDLVSLEKVVQGA